MHESITGYYSSGEECLSPLPLMPIKLFIYPLHDIVFTRARANYRVKLCRGGGGGEEESGGRGIAGTCHSWDYDDIAEETPSARPALTHPRLTFPRIIKTLDNEISRWMCTISAGIGGDDIIINDSCRVIFFFFFFFSYSILWD